MSSPQTSNVNEIAQHLKWIREQFPALNLEVDGKRAIYFDGPGGTQVPQRVIDAMADCLVRSNSNTHGSFLTSRRTDATIAAAHSAIADLLGCDDDEVVFGPNMTTLTFAMSRAIGRELGPGDEIVITMLDHDANVAPWRALAEKGVTIRKVDINLDTCTLNMHDLSTKITRKTKLVALGYASNAVGTINHIERVIGLAHENGAMVYVDAVHYAPHAPIDVRALDCDFLACSTYKFFGPHMGALYGKREHLKRFRPYKVRPASDELPSRWETGTQNHEGLAGVSAAISYLAELGLRMSPQVETRRDALLCAYRAIHGYERTLAERLISGLQHIPGLTIYGITDPAKFDRRTPTVAIRVQGHTPAELSSKLGERGIFTWEGNYYAINLTERLGVEDQGGMLRIGLVHYNTAEEVDRFLAELNDIVRK
ncbi:MAG TPA: cysteine desulfurase-like protein [Terriglobales bacterium]|nr:cysteine desulfurase-like protein [Terriglobales bacterium]